MSRRLSRTTVRSINLYLELLVLVPWLEEELDMVLEEEEEVKPLGASLPSMKKGSDSWPSIVITWTDADPESRIQSSH